MRQPIRYNSVLDLPVVHQNSKDYTTMILNSPKIHDKAIPLNSKGSLIGKEKFLYKLNDFAR